MKILRCMDLLLAERAVLNCWIVYPNTIKDEAREEKEEKT